jgi:hypothetical protein
MTPGVDVEEQFAEPVEERHRIALTAKCESAWGPEADRRAKLSTYRAVEGWLLDAY